MMAGFEKQLEAIKSKAELHKWIDDLPDGARGLLLIECPEADQDKPTYYRWRNYGDITLEGALYMVKAYEHWMFGDMDRS